MGAHVAKTKKSRTGAYLAISAGALALVVGGAFAANSITLNGGGSVEFGQGLVSTSTCDSDLTAALAQTYDNGTSTFVVSTVEISGIKDYSCAGKTIHVSLVGSEGTVCSVDGTHTEGDYQDSFAITDSGTIGSDDDVTETVYVSSGCDASTVLKVAITTS